MWKVYLFMAVIVLLLSIMWACGADKKDESNTEGF